MPYRLTHTLSRLLFGLLCCVCATFTYAVTSVNDYFTEVWTSHDGLPHNSVNAIAQTEDGYLWFATWEGVARYNGISFTLFSRDAATGIVDAGTRALKASSNNQLWVGGARGGLTLREGFNWYPQDIAQGLVNDILEDHQGNLWIAIEGEGVFLRPHLSEKSYGAEQKVLDIGAYRLVQYKDGPIFAATEQGLYRLGSDLPTPLLLPDVAPDTRVNDLSFDHQGTLLIASDLGAWSYDGESVKRYRNELSNSTITTISEDKSGFIWLGTLSKGLARLGYDQLEFVDTSNGLPNNRVLSWYQDVEGSIWVGTNAGVLRLRSAPFTSINQADGLMGNFTRTVLPITGERFLVGTSQGLSLIIDGKASPASSSYSARQSILSLAQSISGKVYVGTQRAGVYEWFNGDMSPLINRASGLPSDEVRAIYEDSKGTLWLGTTSGVMKIDASGERQLITQENSNLPDNYVMAMAEDLRGRIWIGTAEGVAMYHSSGAIEEISIAGFEGAQYVFGFYIEPGYVWMATDRGLLRYDVNQGTIGGIGKPSGLPIDKIFQVVYDHMGSFWLTSNRGIWKIGYVEAHRVASGELNSIDFEHFDEADGMGSDQVNGGSTPAAVSTRQGDMAFATANGLSMIRPTSLKQLYQYRLPVVLERVDADGVLINPQKIRTLEPGVNRLRIRFAGLSYIMSQRIQYQTKLVGFEDEWNYRENQSVAEYTNLPPGKYEFLVSARYPYGAWSNSDTSYQFEILPFWWQRIEVQVLAFLTLVALLASLVLWRIRVLKLRQVYLAQQIELKTQALREQSERYEKQSKEDPLTGLSNRRAFDEQVRSDFILAFPLLSHLNLAIIDIDHFKQVNDRFSHIVGDEVIKLVASYLNTTVLEPNQVARWGGEEFTVLLHCSPDEAKRICKKLLEGVAQIECPSLEGAFDITVSIGLANGLGCKDYQTLLKRADQALYTAKENGRNRVECFEEFKARG